MKRVEMVVVVFICIVPILMGAVFGLVFHAFKLGWGHARDTLTK